MSQFKNLCIMFCYLSLLICCNKDGSVLLLFVLIACSLVFYVKFRNIYNKLKNFELLKRKSLENQRECFISSLNHDLRIPIIAQLRALELISNEKLGALAPLQKEMIKQTEQSCRCILNLISLLINTYSIENNKHKLIYKRFNLTEVITSCFDELLPEASEKNITFEYDNSDKNLFITADKDEIKKVIYNLLVSAIISSNTGEKVKVKIVSVNGKIKLYVSSDNINSYIYTNLDNRFTTIGQSIRMHFCKKIVELHNGKIQEFNNKCNAFTLELPKTLC